jgi:hypothetical protein
MGIEFWESQLIHRDVVVVEECDTESADATRLSEPCVRGGDEPGTELRIEQQEQENECMPKMGMDESDLLLLVPLIVTRNRAGRVRRKIESKSESESDEDEGIAGCRRGSEGSVTRGDESESRDTVPCAVPAVLRKRRHGILVIRAPGDLTVTSAVQRRVSWGTNQTIEIIREEEEEDQDAAQDQRISLFLFHSSDQRVWFAGLSLVFILASLLPVL